MSKIKKFFQKLLGIRVTPTLVQEIDSRVKEQDYYNNLLRKTVGVPHTRGGKLGRQARNRETKKIMAKILKKK